MKYSICFAMMVVIALTSVVHAQQPALRIMAPRSGTGVLERSDIEGVIRDKNAGVWVIVHPRNVSGYWVQPAVTVNSDGTWSTKAYIGRPGTEDVGKEFEIRAVVGAKANLREGTLLDAWPQAKWESQTIRVKRQ
jgi:hypothetical protein